jgi:RNA polymerase sigma-70 factor (ECF subfamily)
MTELDHFEQFMRTHQNLVFSTAVRLLANEPDAQDISQAVFLKAYEHFAQLADNPAAGGWLRTVTTNLSLNHLSRYRARWRFFSELSGDDEESDYAASLPAPDHFEREVAGADHRALLEKALRRLPPAQRVPLVLFHFEDLAYEAIAERLGTSLSKVKTDIHRGRLALKKYLRPLLDDEVSDPTPSMQANHQSASVATPRASQAPRRLRETPVFSPLHPYVVSA